ncbi:MAG: hypothetical protein IT445_01990 [Phycisphaeraceae bacterium]|nr:hypothetical protein [Phycisphaeraceae bacterium]
MNNDPAQNPLQSYFDWQVTTLMLAYDLVDPIRPAGASEDEIHDRREHVEREVRELSLAQVPQKYLDDESLDWPPQVMCAITRATLGRAQAIIHGAS